MRRLLLIALLLSTQAWADTVKVTVPAEWAYCRVYVSFGPGVAPTLVDGKKRGSDPDLPDNISRSEEVDLSPAPPGTTPVILYYDQDRFLKPAEVGIETPTAAPQFDESFRRHVDLNLQVEPPDAKLFYVAISKQEEMLIPVPGFKIDRKHFYREDKPDPWPERAWFLLQRPGFKDHRFEIDPEHYDQKLTVELLPAPGWANRVERWKMAYQQQPLFRVGFFALVGTLVLSVPLGLVWRRRRQAEATRLDILAAIAASDEKDPNLNKVVGRYRLVGRLGRGGMAVVYKAIPDDTLDEKDQVALKLMSPELAQDQDFRARFLREVDVSRSLHHPNIVRLDDWGEQDGLLYLVMEVVDGDTFKAYMKKPMDYDMFLNLFGQVCQGLAYAHSEGIVHRDLKPANIMVNKKAVVKIMDLGLAKSARPGHDVTKTGDALGTPAYMPPEQMSGGEVNVASDQYSMGVMAFEMLTGRLPFEGKPDDPMALIMQHLQEKPPPIREWRPNLPQAVEQIVERMLAKAPEDRFGSMGEVLAKLQEAIQVGDAFETQVMETPRER